MTEDTWIVWKDCRISGYVVASNRQAATMLASEKYGKESWVEPYEAVHVSINSQN